VNGFYRLDEARAAVDAALAFVRDADALVIDLRANGGGAPDTVAYIASYLLPRGTAPLFEIVPRLGKVQSYRVQTVTGGAWPEGRPAYVLTSRATFSAGEGLAFVLQAHRRAEVVGEQTPGAANPGRAYAVNERFEVVVPNGQVRVPPAARNWEGTGVTPDVSCAAADAPRAAYVRALLAVAARSPGEWRDSLERLASDPPTVP
jgi:C-terminal processing protease CtpA/Prc